MQPSVIRLQGLTFTYGHTPALRDLDLEIQSGQVYALLGRNGAGKTTLIRILLGLLKPQRGTVQVLGLDPWQHRTRLMAQVGIVPEQPDIPPALTAQQLNRFLARLYPTWNAGAVEDRLHRYHIPLHKPFGQLSKGQKEHLLLALALAHRPRLLFLDDPTLGLDPVARRALFDELVEEIARHQTTLFLASQDLEGVERIADRVGILQDGQLLVDQSIDRLKTRFRRVRVTLSESDPAREWVPAVLRRLRCHRLRHWALGLEAVVEIDDPAELDGLRPQLPDRQLSIQAMRLEDIFITLVGDGGAG